MCMSVCLGCLGGAQALLVWSVTSLNVINNFLKKKEKEGQIDKMK